MDGMLKAICIIVLIVCIGVVIYTTINAIQTSKRNKASDEINRKIFMANLQKDMSDKGYDISDSGSQRTSSKIIWDSSKEVIQQEEQLDPPANVKLKDFFGN